MVKPIISWHTEKLVERIISKEGVWFATCQQIAEASVGRSEKTRGKWRYRMLRASRPPRRLSVWLEIRPGLTTGSTLAEVCTLIPDNSARLSDGVALPQAEVSRKQWTNLHSDLTAAIHTSGQLVMLKTSEANPTKKREKKLIHAAPVEPR